RTHGRRAGRIAWIDVHTGLGPSGVGERIFAGRDDAACLARARAWRGGAQGQGITSIYDGSASPAVLPGLVVTSIYDECPHAEYTGMALEYGTVPVMETFQALRAQQWLRAHPEAPREQADAIRAQVKAAFYTDTDTWRGQILAQADEALA